MVVHAPLRSATVVSLAAAACDSLPPVRRLPVAARPTRPWRFDRRYTVAGGNADVHQQRTDRLAHPCALSRFVSTISRSILRG